MSPELISSGLANRAEHTPPGRRMSMTRLCGFSTPTRFTLMCSREQAMSSVDNSLGQFSKLFMVSLKVNSAAESSMQVCVCDIPTTGRAKAIKM